MLTQNIEFNIFCDFGCHDNNFGGKIGVLWLPKCIYLYKMTQRALNTIATPLIYMGKDRARRQLSNAVCIIFLSYLGAEINGNLCTKCTIIVVTMETKYTYCQLSQPPDMIEKIYTRHWKADIVPDLLTYKSLM